MEPDTTSFKMPTIETPALNPQLIEKSQALSSIYQRKDQFEKKYGEIVKSLSPLKEINKQYDFLQLKTQKAVKDALKKQEELEHARKMAYSTIDQESVDQEKSLMSDVKLMKNKASPDEKKRSMSKQSKISKVLKTLHKDVLDVQM